MPTAKLSETKAEPEVVLMQSKPETVEVGKLYVYAVDRPPVRCMVFETKEDPKSSPGAQLKKIQDEKGQVGFILYRNPQGKAELYFVDEHRIKDGQGLLSISDKELVEKVSEEKPSEEVAPMSDGAMKFIAARKQELHIVTAPSDSVQGSIRVARQIETESGVYRPYDSELNVQPGERALIRSALNNPKTASQFFERIKQIVLGWFAADQKKEEKKQIFQQKKAGMKQIAAAVTTPEIVRANYYRKFIESLDEKIHKFEEQQNIKEGQLTTIRRQLNLYSNDIKRYGVDPLKELIARREALPQEILDLKGQIKKLDQSWFKTKAETKKLEALQNELKNAESLLGNMTKRIPEVTQQLKEQIAQVEGYITQHKDTIKQIYGKDAERYVKYLDRTPPGFLLPDSPLGKPAQPKTPRPKPVSEEKDKTSLESKLPSSLSKHH